VSSWVPAGMSRWRMDRRRVLLLEAPLITALSPVKHGCAACSSHGHAMKGSNGCSPTLGKRCSPGFALVVHCKVLVLPAVLQSTVISDCHRRHARVSCFVRLVAMEFICVHYWRCVESYCYSFFFSGKWMDAVRWRCGLRGERGRSLACICLRSEACLLWVCGEPATLPAH
jgi:hypothetical protein